jgi:NAD(P)-dependent dehydrogenase (short-subunit alcohol dehydrogenase family)
MNINETVAIVTGAGSGIGAAVCHDLAIRGAKTVVLVDRRDSVYDLADSINSSVGRQVAEVKVGDTK